MKKSKIHMMAAIASIMSEGNNMFHINDEPKPKPTRKPKQDKLKPGQKWYYFFNEFNYSTKLREGYIFKCKAMNEKNAIRKFKNWENENKRKN